MAAAEEAGDYFDMAVMEHVNVGPVPRKAPKEVPALAPLQATYIAPPPLRSGGTGKPSRDIDGVDVEFSLGGGGG